MKTRLAILVLVLLSACSKNSGPVPQSWLVDPEIVSNNTELDLEEPTEDLENTTDNMFGATTDGLNEVKNISAPIWSQAPNIVPWQLTGLMAEFTVTARGLLGPLIMRGAASVTGTWLKKSQKREEDESADVVVHEWQSVGDLPKMIEPIIRALVKTEKVKNEHVLRKNLLIKASKFLDVAKALSKTEPQEWWVSRYRLDLAVEVTGLVTPTISASAEPRIRLEWHRLMRKELPAPNQSAVELLPNEQKIADFMNSMSVSLGSMSDELKPVTDRGFVLHTFRVGAGYSLEGDIGVARSISGAVGHIYFSRDINKLGLAKKSDVSQEQILIIDKKNFGVDIKTFKNGLKKAAKISKFFTKQASKARPDGSWRIYEIRLAFDIAPSGKVGLVTLGGVATTEFSFLNTGF